MTRFLPVAALALILSGCAATPVIGTASPEGSSITSAVAAAGEAAGGGGGGTPFDACALVSAADVEALIGKNDGGRASSAPGAGGGGCVWTNKDNEYSVSVDIGDTDTAINGLPAQDPAFGEVEPLPDGMQYFAGAVDFAAKGRKCSVQIATNETTDGGDKAAAVKLAQAVKAKI